MAIGFGLLAALISAPTLAAETTAPSPTTNAAKIVTATVVLAPKRSTAAVAPQTYRSAACQGAWCGRQVVLFLGIGY